MPSEVHTNVLRHVYTQIFPEDHPNLLPAGRYIPLRAMTPSKLDAESAHVYWRVEVRQKTSCWLVSWREPAAGESTLLCNAYNCWLISLQQPWVMHTICLVWVCVRCCSLSNFPYCSNSLNRSNQSCALIELTVIKVGTETKRVSRYTVFNYQTSNFILLNNQ